MKYLGTRDVEGASRVGDGFSYRAAIECGAAAPVLEHLEQRLATTL